MAHSNVCTHIKACKGTKHQKLASFAQFCYSVASYKSGNTQEIETLLHSNISQRAGEKGSNSFLPRLTSPFNVMTGAVFSATMMLSAPAFAKDAGHPTVQPVSISQQITETMTVEEIRKIPDFYKDKIILHYDNGMKRIDANVLALQRSGFDAFSVPAGDTGCGVRLIVSGVTGNKFCFTQSNLDKGEVGGLAIALLPKVQQRQSQQAQAAAAVQHVSLDQN